MYLAVLLILFALESSALAQGLPEEVYEWSHYAGAAPPLFPVAGTVAADADLNGAFQVAAAPDGGFIVSATSYASIWEIDANGVYQGFRIFEGRSPAVESIAVDRLARVFVVAEGVLYASSKRGEPLRPVPGATAAASVAVNPRGDVYVAAGSRIWVVSGDLRLTPVAGSGGRYSATSGVLALSAGLELLGQMGFDAQGVLHFTDRSQDRVWRIDPQGRLQLDVSLFDLNARAELGGRFGLQQFAVGPGGDLYLYEANTGRLFRRSVTGAMTPVAGGGKRTIAPGVAAKEASFAIPPSAIALSASGRLLVTFAFPGQVLSLDSSGVFELVAGFRARAGVDGPAAAASFGMIRSMAMGPDGRLYVADPETFRVRRIDSSGIVSTFAGVGFAANGGLAGGCRAGPAKDAAIEPVAMLFTPGGELVFSEARFSALCVIDTSGNLREVLSQASIQAQLGRFAGTLQSLAWGPDGAIYATSWQVGTNPIYRITLEGRISVAVVGTVSSPRTVAIEPGGTIYYSAFENERGVIRYVNGSGARGIIDGTEGSRISSLKFDSEGRLHYAAGTRLYRQERDGTLRTIAGGEGRAAAGLAASLTRSFNDFVFDRNGHLLAGDPHQIITLSPAGAPRFTKQGGDLQNGPVGRSVAEPLKLRVATMRGNPLAGRVVSFRLVEGSAQLSPGPTVTTDEAGEARAYVKFGGTPGRVRFDASYPGSDPVSFHLTSTPSAPAERPLLFEEALLGGGLSSTPVRRISSNAIVSLFGEDLAPTGTFRSPDPSEIFGSRLPETLAGTCVELDGRRAPMLLVTPSQVNFIVPPVVAERPVRVRLVRGCGSGAEVTSNEIAVESAARTPELLSFGNFEGKPQVVAVSTQTGELLAPRGWIPGVSTRPARQDEWVTLFAVGLGQTSPSVEPGIISAAAAAVSQRPVLGGPDFGGMQVQYAGVTPGFAGLYQINAEANSVMKSGLRIEFPDGTRSPLAYLAVEDR